MMWLAFLINLTAYPASSGLLPYVAKRVYQVDATGLGWLVASFALGGLLASLADGHDGGPAPSGALDARPHGASGTRCCSASVSCGAWRRADHAVRSPASSRTWR